MRIIKPGGCKGDVIRCIGIGPSGPDTAGVKGEGTDEALNPT